MKPREIKDIKEAPPPTKDGETIFIEVGNGWVDVYTAKDGEWGAPYRCYPATMD